MFFYTQLELRSRYIAGMHTPISTYIGHSGQQKLLPPSLSSIARSGAINECSLEPGQFERGMQCTCVSLPVSRYFMNEKSERKCKKHTILNDW